MNIKKAKGYFNWNWKIYSSHLNSEKVYAQLGVFCFNKRALVDSY